MIKGINKILTVLFAALCMLMSSSCNKKVIFTDSVVMPEKIWSLQNIPQFSFQVSDTITSADVSFSIRTGADYPYRNIYLFVTASSPDGKTISDTLQYELADEKGNWFGKGPGDIHELNLPYRTNIYFPMKGTYVFHIQHGMRKGELEGVYDFGIRIVKTGM
jgi:gliding motility-associated lipoprotein GldH